MTELSSQVKTLLKTSNPSKSLQKILPLLHKKIAHATDFQIAMSSHNYVCSEPLTIMNG